MSQRSIILVSLVLSACPALDTDADGVIDSEDCGPLDPEIHPGAAELCDGVDSDCDGLATDAEDDPDGDHSWACGADCAPEDGTRGPAAAELCNGIDDDCNGILRGDEGDPDGDGMAACEGDCAPGDPARGEGLPELCDGLDNDCDYQVPPDEVDGDGDGVRLCMDCDDGDAGRFPGNTDLCNRREEDCDGEVDDDADWDGSHAASLVDVLGPEDAWVHFSETLPGVDRSGQPAHVVGHGAYVLLPGDLDGDGFADVVVSGDDAAYVFRGPFCAGTLPASAADAVIDLRSMVVTADFALSRAGDLNQDGRDDLRAGPYIYYGPVVGELEGEDADVILYHWAGSTAVGDFNGDGVPDLAVGNYGGSVLTDLDAGAGVVMLHFGPLGHLLEIGNADSILEGVNSVGAQSFAGAAIANAGDGDGDGSDDLAIFSPMEDTGGVDRGAVYLWRSPYPEYGSLADAWATWTEIREGEGVVGAIANFDLAAVDTLAGEDSRDIIVTTGAGFAIEGGLGQAWNLPGQPGPGTSPPGGFHPGTPSSLASSGSAGTMAFPGSKRAIGHVSLPQPPASGPGP